MFGAVVKNYYSSNLNISKENLFVASLMPCTAKKYEAKRKEMNNDVDAVITTVEFANLLKEKEIEWVGLDNLVIKEINGTKFGFLAFDNTISRVKDNDYELVKMADEKVDVHLVMVHWGVEYQAIANKEQRLIAEKIIDSGGDLIIGSHPHWVQNVEEIKGKKVFYSLGNFVFDQAWSEETKKGMAVKLLFEGKELVETEEMPVYMKNLGQPEWVEK
jgi:iron only hydrogenase large subunit-like protein